ncbi:2-amino-4-hydroxy-6-hydroxymethyldihydropteridine diphosphokinase [Anaerorudis cellulosivorans]|uniref:2-amino-4-hydroxy-6- hydroxymethyldihydropteridine diphosphokinase n=1 Tax=Anaerorudis cellulosivorans TaxID=3397862 RepID=UPI0022207E39|nr:2-amino-4-hydroxy-6-hydroxymethyldihydropteridine diphosphokinase [Seramator thermalis]MCW1734896.1 2-amino-4-hydroxy-6-hydroxymethyldihydropteridine diphosphokinase [Seramator thermalis]
MAYRIFLGLGSNLGDKEKNIEEAYRRIEERIGKIVSKSAFYVTRPEGFLSENWFVNTVCEVVSDMPVDEVFAITQTIEKQLGRTKKSENGNYADRVIDIDMLMVDDSIIDTPELTVPHPRMHLRRFVLVPFAEIAPDVVHPVFKQSIRDLLEQLPQ